MFYASGRNVGILIALLAWIPSIVIGQNAVDVRTGQWQVYLETHTQWIQSRQLVAQLTVEHAQADFDWRSRKASAERELLVHEHQLKAYQEGLREVRLTALKNEIVVITERVKQAKVRREWSVKLANRGLISQKELEADEIAVERLVGQLQSKKDELKLEEDQQVSTTEAGLIAAREKAREALVVLEQEGDHTRKNRQAALKAQQAETMRLQKVLEQKQVEFQRLREFLERRETNSQPEVNREQIQELEEDMQASRLAEKKARTTTNTETELWQQKLKAATLDLSTLEDDVQKPSLEIQEQAAAVQSAQEKVNQSIQNESWADRVHKKGFITQVLYEKYSLELLEARQQLAYQQQKLEVDSALALQHATVLRDFDLRTARVAVDALQEIARQQQSYVQTMLDSHREQTSRQQDVLAVLKQVQPGTGD